MCLGIRVFVGVILHKRQAEVELFNGPSGLQGQQLNNRKSSKALASKQLKLDACVPLRGPFRGSTGWPGQPLLTCSDSLRYAFLMSASLASTGTCSTQCGCHVGEWNDIAGNVS